jgi:protein disulfide-isomerase
MLDHKFANLVPLKDTKNIMGINAILLDHKTVTSKNINMKSKSLLITFFFLLSLISVHASDLWKINFEAALKEANDQNKNVLVNFTGSDWCGWCIKLDKEVFSKDAFKQFADNELVLVKIDFPRRQQQSAELITQNEKLLDKYGIRGFPTIVLLSSDGQLLEKTGYKAGGADVYIEHIKDIIGK